MLELLLGDAKSPTYTLTQDKTSANEGDVVTFTLETENVKAGTTLYWTTAGGVGAADFSDNVSSGSFSHTDSTNVTRTLKNDLSTEGSENFTLQIRKDSVSGQIVATSQQVTVIDTSTAPPIGQVAFTTVGTSSWTVPAGVTSICAVAVGGGGGGASGATATQRRGGGGGGALSYVNSVAVTPGEVLTVTVGAGGIGGTAGATGGAGGESSIKRSSTYLARAGGGNGGSASSGTQAAGGVSYNSGGTGGKGGGGVGSTYVSAGGGGAGGYSPSGTTIGTKGNGHHNSGSQTYVAQPGLNGGGGGGGMTSGAEQKYGNGGGVGILGQGADGLGGVTNSLEGKGGSGGSNAGLIGGLYGGGGCGQVSLYNGNNGGQGAVRIIWGANRSFPSTNTGNL